MRHRVREYVHAAVVATREDLERYVSDHVRYPDAFRFVLRDLTTVIKELRNVRVTPRVPGDYPAVDVVITLDARISAHTRRDEAELGRRAFRVDVEVRALGRPAGTGYSLIPHAARMMAWWGHVAADPAD